MIHIRKKDSSFDPKVAYTVVITELWNQPLDQHPSILEHPELFEIVDCDPPSHSQYMWYNMMPEEGI